jgi:hypothetical protein
MRRPRQVRASPGDLIEQRNPGGDPSGQREPRPILEPQFEAVAQQQIDDR